MALSKKPIKSYKRTSAAGRAVEVHSHSREVETTPNQDSGLPDPFHNDLISSSSAHRKDGGIVHSVQKFRTIAPNLYADLLTQQAAQNKEIEAQIARQEKEVENIIRQALQHENRSR